MKNRVGITKLEYFLMLEALDYYYMYWELIYSKCDSDDNKKMLDSVNALQVKLSFNYFDRECDTVNITNDELLYLYRAVVYYSYNKCNKYINETNKIISDLKDLLVELKRSED